MASPVLFRWPPVKPLPPAGPPNFLAFSQHRNGQLQMYFVLTHFYLHKLRWIKNENISKQHDYCSKQSFDTTPNILRTSMWWCWAFLVKVENGFHENQLFTVNVWAVTKGGDSLVGISSVNQCIYRIVTYLQLQSVSYYVVLSFFCVLTVFW